MASETAQVSSLPLPPQQYVNLYSEENVRRGKAPKPPLPIHDTYSMFGNTFHADDAIIRPLESQGIRRLYPQHFDPRRELRKLNHSVLASFLDLLEQLVRSPECPRREEKLEDLQLLLVHMHHLVNEFRPHQARETLRVALEMQKRQRVETSERFTKHLERAMELLEAALNALPGKADLDCKLLVPLPGEIQAQDGADVTDTGDACSGLDRLMCDIIDAL